jgi:glycosyltransferase involved in cell wall biosynthesis
MLAHRVIEYGKETAYFRFFLGKRGLLIGNGIDRDRMPLRKKNYPDGDELLSMIGVGARLESWHGFDRVVRAMGEWKKQGRKPQVTLDLVGNPDTLHVGDIKKIIKNYGLEEDVRFLGLQPADVLDKMYDRETLAISSLANFRRGLYCASVLKAREYCLAGIPFVSADDDPDFPAETPFRFAIPNDDSIDAIINIFESFADRRHHFTDESIRQYAVERLSFDGKFKEIMRGL